MVAYGRFRRHLIVFLIFNFFFPKYFKLRNYTYALQHCMYFFPAVPAAKYSDACSLGYIVWLRALGELLEAREQGKAEKKTTSSKAAV